MPKLKPCRNCGLGSADHLYNPRRKTNIGEKLIPELRDRWHCDGYSPPEYITVYQCGYCDKEHKYKLQALKCCAKVKELTLHVVYD